MQTERNICELLNQPPFSLLPSFHRSIVKFLKMDVRFKREKKNIFKIKPLFNGAKFNQCVFPIDQLLYSS